MTFDGKRHGQRLDLMTGWPVSRLASGTVLGAICVVAGSAATIGMPRDETRTTWIAGLGLSRLRIVTDSAGGASRGLRIGAVIEWAD